MNKFEELEQEAADQGIQIVPYDLPGTELKGLYCNGVVALANDMETSIEKSCIPAEELSHHYTTVGNILNQNTIVLGNRRILPDSSPTTNKLVLQES